MDLGTVWCENKVNLTTSRFSVLARVCHYRRESSGFTKKRKCLDQISIAFSRLPFTVGEVRE